MDINGNLRIKDIPLPEEEGSPITNESYYVETLLERASHMILRRTMGL